MKKLLFTFIILISINIHAMKIITTDHDPDGCLSSKAEAILLTDEGLKEAAIIIAQMKETLLPLMPAAGLAAPQIGISKGFVRKGTSSG